MSFFKKVLSSVGFGAAKIDTIFLGEAFYPGQDVQGIVHVKGGDVEQHIERLYFELHCDYEATLEVEQDEQETEIEMHRAIPLVELSLAESFTIQANAEKEIPFSFQLPEYTPITNTKVPTKNRVWLNTGADIKNAIDPKDRDYIKVIASPEIETLIDAIESIGFRLSEVECEEDESDYFSPLPFVQEFEFKAVSGDAIRRYKELEIIYSINDGYINLLLETDRKTSGFESLLHKISNRDTEVKANISIPLNDINNVEHYLKEYLFS